MAKNYNEMKYQILYFAEKLGTEKKLRKLFDNFEKIAQPEKLSPSQLNAAFTDFALQQNTYAELNEAFQYLKQLPKNKMSEERTRAGIMATAEKMGIDKREVTAILSKYDNLAKRSTTESERQEVAYMCGAELHRLFGFTDALVMDGKTIIPAQKEHISGGKIIKLD